MAKNIHTLFGIIQFADHPLQPLVILEMQMHLIAPLTGKTPAALLKQAQ